MSQSNCIPRYDQDAENFTPSEAASSITHEPPYYIGDTRTQSSRKSKDEGSNFSLYTYYSQADAPKFIKEVDGRGYNTQNDTYFLPSGMLYLKESGRQLNHLALFQMKKNGTGCKLSVFDPFRTYVKFTGTSSTLRS